MKSKERLRDHRSRGSWRRGRSDNATEVVRTTLTLASPFPSGMVDPLRVSATWLTLSLLVGASADSGCGRLRYEREVDSGRALAAADAHDIDAATDAPRDDAATDAPRDAAATDAPPHDTPAGPCSEPSCMAAGGSCVGSMCEIVARSEAAAACPTGMPCRVLCVDGSRPCRDGVSCGAAGSCEVRCVGNRACQDGVDCGTSACEVTCSGTDACEAGVRGGAGGSCTSHCCAGACAGGVTSCTQDSTCL